MHAIPAPVAALGAALVLAGSALAQRAPSKKELEAAVAALVALDPADKASHGRALELVAPWASQPLPKESELEKHRQAIAKARAKAATLPETSGEHWVDPRTCAPVDRGTRGAGRLFVGGDTKSPKGLLIGLHGGGVGSGDASSSRDAYQGLLGSRDWVGLFPEVIEKTEHGWTDAGTEEWLVRLVHQATAQYGVPPDQVFLTGHSMGGYGTWVVGAHHADLFAALAASAGAPTPVYGPERTIVDVVRGVVPNLRNMPFVVYQSTDDVQVPPEANQGAVARIAVAKERFGGYERFEYWEVHDRGHAYPEGGPEALLAKVDMHRRHTWPTKVVWEPVLPWKQRFHWLEWPEPKWRTVVIAEAFPAERRIAVLVEGGDGKGLGLLLGPALLPLGPGAGPLVVELNGAEVYRGEPAPSFGTWLRTAALGDRGREASVHVTLR